MSYYSFGQVLAQTGTANLTSTQTSGSTTGGGTVLDAATFRHMQAVAAQRTGTTGEALAAPRLSYTLLAPLQPVAPTQNKTVALSPESMAALGPPRPGAAGTLPGSGGGGGGGSMPTDAAQFAAACKEANGTVVSPLHCKLGDGAIVTVDAQGNATCANAVGRCAAAGKPGRGALMIGAAAIAALMLLR